MGSVALAAIAVAALALAAAVGVQARRARRETRAQLTQGLDDLRARLDGLAQELGQAVETVRDEGLRARLVGSLGGTLDVDEVLARCAEAAASLSGVAAAAVTLTADGGLPRVAAVGVDPSTVGAMVGPPGGATPRVVGLSYHYREGQLPDHAMHSAVAVPISSGGATIGFLTVYGPTEEPPVAGAAFQTLETIAQHAGPAIEKARLATERQPPEADALTGLANRQALHDALALEVARAHRSGRGLALAVLDVDDLGAANERLGQAATDRLLSEIAGLLREGSRPGDHVYRSGGDEFTVVLTGSGRIEAEATFARVQASLRRLQHPAGIVPSLSVGIAELKADDDGVSLFERAERALRRNQEGEGLASPAKAGDARPS